MGNCFKLQRAAESWVDDEEWEVDMTTGGNKNEVKVAGEKTGRVEVKIRVTKRQVQELLQQAARDGKGKRATEKVLADLINSGTVCYHDDHETRCHWRPSLQSITEADEP
ncbi:uncharacterized protein LOC123440361 [Hordeum vulgare subsp. vulgare]|uniref:Uncharacterized protein n=1 Tax=Hordeum vulgare subsp. vulgare TaxID=112509 RepID=A0A8I6X455_HORVV|nr:uncharacterized protein LOC123440361 [Hordeum vulgare subsp. vulgare]KAI5007439.1 hypothetical protein ZWY2020_050884 [Hordeum vulgare]